MVSANEFRIVLIVLGALVLGAIWWIGTRRRMPAQRREPERESTRIDPTVGGIDDPDAEAADPQPTYSRLGARPEAAFDKVLTIHLMARGEALIEGASLLVAAEKASLVHGDRGLFHRLLDDGSDGPPVFSVINRLKPGSFDLDAIDALQTPGVSFFMTLPGPLGAIDAWDRMHPAAQRMAELLDAQLLDEEGNPLNRQRVASIRDELRGYDREQAQRAARSGRWT